MNQSARRALRVVPYALFLLAVAGLVLGTQLGVSGRYDQAREMSMTAAIVFCLSLISFQISLVHRALECNREPEKSPEAGRPSANIPSPDSGDEESRAARNAASRSLKG